MSAASRLRVSVRTAVVTVIFYRKLFGHCSHVVLETASWARGVVETVAPRIVVVAAFFSEDEVQSGFHPNGAESVVRRPAVGESASHDIVFMRDRGQVKLVLLLLWALGQINLDSLALVVRLFAFLELIQ